MKVSRLIYVVDDESNIRNLIQAYLKKEGYEVEIFSSGEEMLARFNEKKPHMCIIDIMMPGIDGYELCRKIREKSDVPIIIVSAKDKELDKILGLELGGDDYLTKPFSPRELVARVKTVFRRIPPVKPKQRQILTAGNVNIYIDERRVEVDGVNVELTTKEFDLLYYLCLNKNMAFTREELINKVWGYDYYGRTRAVDDVIKRLRKKFKACNGKINIKTVWGYGYKVEE